MHIEDGKFSEGTWVVSLTHQPEKFLRQHQGTFSAGGERIRTRPETDHPTHFEAYNHHPFGTSGGRPAHREADFGA